MPSSSTPTKGSRLNFNLTPEFIVASTKERIEQERAMLNSVAAVESPTFASVVVPMSEYGNAHNYEDNVSYLLQNTSTDSQVRDAGAESVKLCDEFAIECKMREDVYNQVRAVYDNKDEMDQLYSEDRRLVEKMELKYRRAGMLLPKVRRDELAMLNKKLVDIKQQFSKNCNEQVGKALFTREELAGMPESFFDDRKAEEVDGVTKFEVTTKYPDYFPLMKNAKLEATRKAMYVVSSTRCPENVDLLQEIVKLRQTMAQILGYKTHAEYVTEALMSKTPQAVIDMENDMRNKLTPLGKSELAVLETLKKEDMDAQGMQYNGFFKWDTSYYSNIQKEKKFQIKTEMVKEYFPFANVSRGILDIYQNMLGLRVVKVEDPEVWHQDVEMFEVWEANDDVFVGHMYMDLFPRDNKYQHAACFSLRSGYGRKDGTREYPAAALVTNFSKPTSTTPSLLTQDEVKTFMHELGHVFHHLCSKTKWSCFHGLNNIEMDFVECPSQMLENWAWEPAALQKFACHYKTGKVIPSELVNNLVAAKNHGAGLAHLFQVCLGTFDMEIYNSTDKDLNVNKLFNEMNHEIVLVNPGEEATHRVATFSHTAGAYAAKYFGYMWSKSFAADLYASRFLKDGIDNPQTGMDYRMEILKPGSSRDAMDSMVKFLGRKPNNDAFLKSIGLDTN